MFKYKKAPSLKYFVSSIIYFIFLLFLFFTLPTNNQTRSQGFGFFYLFLSYIWVPIGIVIGVVSAGVTIFFNRRSKRRTKILLLVSNLLFPLFVALILIVFTGLKAQLHDNPSCVQKIATHTPLTSITNVQMKQLDRDINDQLDTVRIDFDIIYMGEKVLSSLVYAELLSPEDDNQLIMYQWDGLPDDSYPGGFPRVNLHKGTTHVIRYLDIHEYTPIDIFPKLKEQILNITLKWDIDQPGNCTCTACSRDIFVFSRHTQKTQFDLTKFTPNPFNFDEYQEFKNKDSI